MKRNLKLKWGLLVCLLALWLVGLIGVGMTVYNHTRIEGENKATAPVAQVVSSVFTVLGGLSVILTLYFSIWQSIEANDAKVLDNTFSLIRSWDDPALLTARKYTRELADKQNQLSPEQIIAQVNENAELRQSVIQVFNYIEIVGYSINAGRVDRKAICRMMGNALIRIYERFLPWIKDMNRVDPNYEAVLKKCVESLRDPIH